MRNPAFIGLCLLAALCYGEAHAQAPPQPTAKYHRDAMNLDFNYPSSFASQDADGVAYTLHLYESAKSAGAGKSCVSTPVAAMDMRTGFNVIFLRRFDGACIGKQIAADRGSAAANFLNDTLGQLGKPDLSKGTDYEISGHSASSVSGAVKLKGVKPAGTVVYGVGSCAAVGKDLVCFVFLSSDCRTLAAISASTVKFADVAAAPIIPSNMSLACKP